MPGESLQTCFELEPVPGHEPITYQLSVSGLTSAIKSGVQWVLNSPVAHTTHVVVYFKTKMDWQKGF